MPKRIIVLTCLAECIYSANLRFMNLGLVDLKVVDHPAAVHLPLPRRRMSSSSPVKLSVARPHLRRRRPLHLHTPPRAVFVLDG